MKLYINQKVFSWKDRFTVYNENEEPRYRVMGELFSWGKKLHVFDLNEREIAYIEEKVLTMMPGFRVYIGENQVAEIVKKFTFFKPAYSIKGLDWDIQGNFSAHDYEIRDGEKRIVTIHKKWLSFGDVYELDISDEEQELYALAVVLAIDTVTAASSAAAAATT